MCQICLSKCKIHPERYDQNSNIFNHDLYMNGMKKLRTLFFIMCMAYFAGCIFASCEAPEIGSEVEDGAHDNTDGTDGTATTFQQKRHW